MRNVKWTLRPTGGGAYEGEIQLLDGALTVKSKGATKGAAVARAAKLAEAALDNPLVKAVLPPGTGAAIELAKKLGLAQNAGQLASVASNVVGPGAKRLAKALKFW